TAASWRSATSASVLRYGLAASVSDCVPFHRLVIRPVWSAVSESSRRRTPLACSRACAVASASTRSATLGLPLASCSSTTAGNPRTTTPPPRSVDTVAGIAPPGTSGHVVRPVCSVTRAPVVGSAGGAPSVLGLAAPSPRAVDRPRPRAASTPFASDDAPPARPAPPPVEPDAAGDPAPSDAVPWPRRVGEPDAEGEGPPSEAKDVAGPADGVRPPAAAPSPDRDSASRSAAPAAPF